MTNTLMKFVFSTGAATSLALAGIALAVGNADAFTIVKTTPLNVSNNRTSNATGTNKNVTLDVTQTIPGVDTNDVTGDFVSTGYSSSRWLLISASITATNVQYTSTLFRTSGTNWNGNITAHSFTLNSIQIQNSDSTMFPVTGAKPSVNQSPLPSATPTVLTTPATAINISSPVFFTPNSDYADDGGGNPGGDFIANLTDVLSSPTGRQYTATFTPVNNGSITVTYNYAFIPEPNMAVGVLAVGGLGLLLRRKSGASPSEKDKD